MHSRLLSLALLILHGFPIPSYPCTPYGILTFYSLQKYKRKLFRQGVDRYAVGTCHNAIMHAVTLPHIVVLMTIQKSFHFQLLLVVFVRVIAVIDIIIAVARIRFFRFHNLAETILQLLIMVSWHYFQLKCLKLFPICGNVNILCTINETNVA